VVVAGDRDVHQLPPGHRHRRLLQDSGALNARILRLPRPVVKDYACPFPFPETLGVAADEIDTY